LCRCDVQRRYALWKTLRARVKAIPGLSEKTVRLPAGIAVHLQPGILFAFTPESFSRSSRNPVHLGPESAPWLSTALRQPNASLWSRFWPGVSSMTCPPGSSVTKHDSDKLDEKLAEEYGIELIAPNRRKRSKTQDGRKLRRYRRRWRVERLFAWMHNFRRLVTRWEYHIDNFLGFVHLACLQLLLTYL
jgi:hypothetical protein